MRTTNFDLFVSELTDQYTTLFAMPQYARAASLSTPQELSIRMAKGLLEGSADKDGEGVKQVCKKLNIPCTYKGIKAYLQ